MEVGNVVEYKNVDEDYKLAILVENVSGIFFDAITFSGQIRRLAILEDGFVPGGKHGVIAQVVAENLNEYLSQVKLS